MIYMPFSRRNMDGDEDDQSLGDGPIELAQFILYRQSQKKGCIKEADFRGVLTQISAAGEMRERCVNQTTDFLDRVVGVKLFKLQTVRGYRLFVGNALEKKHGSGVENCYSNEEKAKYGLLIAVLVFLYMMHVPGSRNYVVSESTLRNFLKEMGITEGGCFGSQSDLNKLLGTSVTAEFISQGWLSYTKELDECGNDIVSYGWGERSKAFVDPMAILRTFCIMHGSTPQEWKSYYEETKSAAVAFAQKQ